MPYWPRGLREHLAAEYVGLSVTTLRIEREAGRFPAPVYLTKGRYVYLRDMLDEWLETKLAQTHADPALAPGSNPWDDLM